VPLLAYNYATKNRSNSLLIDALHFTSVNFTSDPLTFSLQLNLQLGECQNFSKLFFNVLTEFGNSSRYLQHFYYVT